MSFTDQKPFVVTEAQTKLRWGGGFHCKLCGLKFEAGQTIRWVYANGTPGLGCGNFFVCSECNGPDVLQRAKEDFTNTMKAAKRWNIYG